MSGWLVACDLDQTLLYSRRSFRLRPGQAVPDTVVVEHLDGAPAAFVTRRAAGLLAQLAAVATVVPVTTRTLEQYGRIRLGIPARFAVAANGGHLLVDGAPDAVWAAAVRRRVQESSRPLADVLAAARRLAAPGWARVVRVADGLFVYLVAHERAGIPTEAVDQLAADLAGVGWTVSVQGRKVYLVPATLTKTAALEEVRARTGGARVAAAGDSVLDREMLARADIAVLPRHGELYNQGWTSPQVRLTRSAGLLAGEEVLEALLAACRPPGP